MLTDLKARQAKPREKADCAERAGLAFEGGYLRTFEQLDVGLGGDPLDQVARHGVRQRPAGDEGYPARMPRQEYRGLARGVAASDQSHVLAGTESRLQRRSPVVDGGAFEALEAVNVEPAVARARGDHHGPRASPLAVGERQAVIAPVAASGHSSRSASSGMASSTPNFCAWL